MILWILIIIHFLKSPYNAPHIQQSIQVQKNPLHKLSQYSPFYCTPISHSGRASQRKPSSKILDHRRSSVPQNTRTKGHSVYAHHHNDYLHPLMSHPATIAKQNGEEKYREKKTTKKTPNPIHNHEASTDRKHRCITRPRHRWNSKTPVKIDPSFQHRASCVFDHLNRC